MSIDERFDRVTERYEALSQSRELLTHDERGLLALMAQPDSENIRGLSGIEGIHERRLSDLEGRN